MTPSTDGGARFFALISTRNQRARSRMSRICTKSVPRPPAAEHGNPRVRLLTEFEGDSPNGIAVAGGSAEMDRWSDESDRPNLPDPAQTLHWYVGRALLSKNREKSDTSGSRMGSDGIARWDQVPLETVRCVSRGPVHKAVVPRNSLVTLEQLH